jgi:peptidyl-prolyl cis-trans isomerase D
MVSQTLPISAADLQKRYEFRRDTLSQPETRSLVQIPVKDAAAGQAVAARLNRGEDPAAVAKSLGVEAIVYEDKPRTAVADPKVGQAAFALKAGQVSSPIQGGLGMAVVKITKVTPGRTVSLEEIRPQLEAELRRDAAGEKVYEMTQVYEDAHADGASLADAAKKAGVPAVTLGPVTAEGRNLQNQPQPGLNPKILQAAFGLAAGAESDLQELGNGEYFAVRVEKVIPKALPPLAEVKPLLARVWMQREMIKRLQARADALAARVKKGESLEAVAASAGSQVVRVPAVSRQTAAQSRELSRDGLTKAFAAKPGEVFTAEHTQFGLIVGRLEQVATPSAAELAPIAENVRPQMTMGLFRDIGDSARRAARAELKVKTYPAKARAALGLPPLDEKGDKGKAENDQ